MTYQFRNENGVLKIYDTRTRKLYWLDRPQGVVEIVALLNEKAAQHSEQSTRTIAGSPVILDESLKKDETRMMRR